MPRTHVRRLILNGAAALTLSVAISGCSSLMNPHVTWERPENLATDPKDPDKLTSLPRAIAYAHRAEDKYREAVGDQSRLTNSLVIPLTALAATALGVGITSQSQFSQDFLVGAGLAGASIYAVGSWFASTPRQRVYIAGVKAMTCAISAVEPLNLGEVDLAGNLTELNKAITKVGIQSSVVRQSIAELLATTGVDTPIVAAARATLQTTTAAIKLADEAYASGIKLQLAIARAGPALENAVDRISTLVDDAIISTESTLEQLPGLIGGLAQSGAQFVQLPEPGLFPQITRRTAGEELDVDAATSEKIARLEAKLRAELGELNGAIEAMVSASRRVAAVVNGVSAGKSFEALEDCGVDIEAAVTAMSTRPSGAIEFEKGKAGNRGFTIHGGEHPYSAQFLDEQDGLTVKQPVAFGATVVVRATDKVPADTYNLQISDVAGNSLILPVTVVATGEDPKDTPTKTADQQLVEDMQEQLKNLGFYTGPFNGMRDQATNAAIAFFLTTIQSKEKDPTKFTTFDFSELFVPVASAIDKSVQKPDGVRSIMIELLLKKLGHDPGPINGVIDDATKAAIMAFNGGSALPVDTEDERTALLTMLRAKAAELPAAPVPLAPAGPVADPVPLAPAGPIAEPVPLAPAGPIAEPPPPVPVEPAESEAPPAGEDG